MIRRMSSLKCVFMVILLICFTHLHIIAQSDSTYLLSYQEYLENILSYHPIAKKAALRTTLAKAELLGAKGSLDPVITSDWNQKNFANKLYYRQYQTKIKLPTLTGVSFTGGYENTGGVFINPENKTDGFGLWHLGVEVNVLQGLVVNERRTALEQAKNFQNLAKIDQRIILNDLVYNATESYIFWQKYEYFKEILIENKTIASTYFANTKESFFNGEKTAMDTLEAFILFQDAKVLIQKNEMDLMKSKQKVNNFLWFNEIPVALQDNTIPEDIKTKILPIPTVFADSNVSNNPKIQASINKLTSYEIDQKLKREKLKPKLKIKYNPLLATSVNSISPNFSINDYKWGFYFSIPLLFRSERAAIQKGEVKIQETKLEILNKRNELKNKIENSWTQQRLLQEQLAMLNQNLENYRLLLEGENEKFNFGESSVFLLNKRQEKYINVQLKVIESFTKQNIEFLNYLYYTNQIVNE